MTANPTLKYASATKDATSAFIMTLLNNTSRGMVQLRTYMDSSCVTEDVDMRLDWCVPQMSAPRNIYISELYDLADIYKTTPTTANSVCIRAHVCNSGENCDTLACGVWNSSYNSQISNIPMEIVFGVTPIAVSNLTLTPGDKEIKASWGDDEQPTYIWAHHVALYQGSTLLIDGWRVKNDMVINNLTNGTLYKIIVKAISFDGFLGPLTEKTATPIASCTLPNCGIQVD